MNKQLIAEQVKSQMPEKRWKHTEGVIASALELAKQYGVEPEKAELASILHDVAKYWPIERMRQVIVDQQLPQELLDYDKALWHAPVGAYVAEHDFGIKDIEILDAIRYHTSGREHMTLLDKVVCLADYMEPGRDFKGVEHIRELSKSSLDKALLAGFESTISFLLAKQQIIFPLTILARNALIWEIQTKEQKGGY
jgi:predicted HD superfamily hydrolase involved in NAD metabolism